MNLKHLSLLLVALCFSFSIYGQENAKRQYKAAKIETPPEIDGELNDAAWLSGEWSNTFTQYEPNNGSEPSQKTEFKLVFDEDYIYVAFKALDTNADSIVSRLSRRDKIDGDLFAVIFDSYHDLRTAFAFGISSAGVKYDLMYTNDGQNEDGSWNPNWWAKTKVGDDGWYGEMKIPFSQVRFDANFDGVWGFNVARYVYRHDEQSFWAHIPKSAPGMIHMFGELAGIEEIKPRKIFDITPYGVAQAETFEKVPDNPFLSSGKKTKLNGGVDAKIGLTNNITMDLTVNPDFGQVEADPSEVNLTAFETYFSEKRTFFIEGKNITSYNIGIGNGDVGNDNLFYSRRIGRNPHGKASLEEGWYADMPTSTKILGAAKITGKTEKGLSVGVIEAVTGNEYATVNTGSGTIEQLVEPTTNYFVGRIQKDFNDGNTLIGGIVTSVNRKLTEVNESYLHKSAYSGGIDYTQYFDNKKWELSVNAAFSQVKGSKEAIAITQQSSARYYQRPDTKHISFDPNRTSLFGSGGRLKFQKLDGHVNLMAAVVWKTPGFEINDLGFMQNANMVLTVLYAGYSQWQPKGIYRSYSYGGNLVLANDFEGNILTRGIEMNGNIQFQNYWSAWASSSIYANGLSSGLLRGGPLMKEVGTNYVGFGFSTDNRAKFEVEPWVNFNSAYYDSQDGTGFGIDFSYKPVKYVTFELEPSVSSSRTEVQYITRASYNNDYRYVFAELNQKVISTSFRINLNVTPDMTFQYWGQPFIASGDYSNYKYVTNPMADKYADRFHIYSGSEISNNNSTFIIDEDVDGVNDYSFNNSDFNVKEFLSNLVFRWEYNPGSTVYVVWSQNRDNYDGSGKMDYFNNIGELFSKDKAFPHNVFLIKFSYRFGLR